MGKQLLIRPKIWEQMITDKGGRERLRAVFSIEQTQNQRTYDAKHWFRPIDTQMVRIFVLPDCMWQWFDGRSSVFWPELERLQFHAWPELLRPPDESPRKVHL